MLRVSTKPRRKNAPRIAEKDAPGYLQWLRGRECIFTYAGGCEGKIEAMHLDWAGGKGIGTKVADRYSVAACSAHHGRQHNEGWATFLKNVDWTREMLLDAALYLWSRWPGRIAWERKLEAGQ